MSSTSSQTRALTPRGAATRARIIRAAADLIYDRGVDRTSLDDVMAASGVSKSQLYHYFADKAALVVEVIAFQTDCVLSVHEPHLTALDSLRALRSWCDAILRIDEDVGRKGCPLGSLANQLVNDFDSAQERLAEGFLLWRDDIARGLTRMRDRGELSPSVQPERMATAVLSAIQGGLLLAKTAQSSEPLRIALDMAIDHVAANLLAPER